MRTAKGGILSFGSRPPLDRPPLHLPPLHLQPLFYRFSSFPLLIPRYQLLPHPLREYICDVGSEIVRSFVSFLWYCLGSITGLAWPSVSARCKRLTTSVQGRSLVLSTRSTL